jgi:hypothetical protein
MLHRPSLSIETRSSVQNSLPRIVNAPVCFPLGEEQALCPISPEKTMKKNKCSGMCAPDGRGDTSSRLRWVIPWRRSKSP